MINSPLSSKAYPAQTYQEGRQQPQPLGHSGGYPPYAEGHSITFPEQYSESSSRQRSATGHPETYATPSTLPQSTVGTYHQDHQEPYGYHPSGGSSSSSHRTYPTSGSVTSGDLYARPEVQNPGASYTVNIQADSQNWGNPGHDEGHHGPDFRQKGPHSVPVASHRPKCRYPGCNNYVFFDRRVNELREFCSDEHMGAAIQRGLEKPCRHCGMWPRRYGYKYCSGDVCRYR